MQCFQATTPQSGGTYGPISTLGTITGGGGYREGTYANVPLTGGSGRGAIATIRVDRGAVVGVTITNPGTHYTGADVLSASATTIGGRGSGFSVPVTAITGTGTGMVGLLGPITPGAGGQDGTYGGVPLTGGAGQGATANIVVQGGRVTNVTILNPGMGYQVDDILSAPADRIGNVIGLQIPVASVAINQSLAGGFVYMFVPNTTNPKQTWQDAAQTQLNQNPVTLNANGCATMYGTGVYRQVLTDSAGNIVWDRPTTSTDVQQVAWAGVALNISTPNLAVLKDVGFNATDGSIVSFIPLLKNTGAFAVSFQGTSYANIPVVLDMFSGPQPLRGNEIAPNNVVVMIYSAAENTFHLLNSGQAATLDQLATQVQQIVAQFALTPTFQVFTAGSGMYVPTVLPAGSCPMPCTVVYIRVRMVAGGAGGGGTMGVGSAGTSTTFENWSVMSGTPGGPSTGIDAGPGGAGGTGGTNGTGTLIARFPGGSGTGGQFVNNGGATTLSGGSGGASFMGGNGGGPNGGTVANPPTTPNVPPGANTGGGGGGGATVEANQTGSAGGGGAGEGVEFIMFHPLQTGYAYTVGTGGAGGVANPNAGFAGVAGAAGRIIVEEYYH